MDYQNKINTNGDPNKNKLCAQYDTFHQEELEEFIYSNRHQEQTVHLALEGLVENEQSALIKAFVDESGRVEEKYSIFHKTYLGVLKKIRTKWHNNVKMNLDDRIIDKCAKEKLKALEEVKETARDLTNETNSKRNEYFDKQLDLEIAASVELSNAKRCKELRKKCQNYIVKLNKELKRKLENNEYEDIDYLRQSNKQAKRDLEHIDVAYEQSNVNAESIHRRLLIIFPAYVQLDLYATALAQQAVHLKNAYEFYYNLFYDLKDLKSQKLIEFKNWNDGFENFLEQHNKQAEENAQKILSILGAKKKQTSLSSWKEALKLFKNAKNKLQDKKFEQLESEQQRMSELELKYNKNFDEEEFDREELIKIKTS